MRDARDEPAAATRVLRAANAVNAVNAVNAPEVLRAANAAEAPGVLRAANAPSVLRAASRRPRRACCAPIVMRADPATIPRMHPLLALGVAALAAACASRDPAAMNPMPAPPWSLTYADGAANVYRFMQVAPGAPVAFEYTPVTPAQSSTGTYSGGEPVHAELATDDARLRELWRRIDALAADTAAHGPDRNKGTGLFRVTAAERPRSFLLEQGAALDDFHRFVQTFRR